MEWQPGYVARQMARLIARDESDGAWRCRYCRVELIRATEWPFDWTKPYPEREHVIPRSRGGSNDPSNLVLACQGCNVRKGARLLSELPVDWHEWRNAARI